MRLTQATLGIKKKRNGKEKISSCFSHLPQISVVIHLNAPNTY